MLLYSFVDVYEVAVGSGSSAISGVNRLPPYETPCRPQPPAWPTLQNVMLCDKNYILRGERSNRWCLQYAESDGKP